MNLLTPRIRSLLLALLLLSLPACAEPDNATTADTSLFEGRVLEAGTKKPIPGAIVLGRWTEVRSAWVDTQDVCVHVETTTSDQDGRFRLPRYRGRNPTYFDSYKVGYEAYRFNTTEAYSRQESWLERSMARRLERLDYLERLEYATRCPSAGESAKNQLLLYRAFYDEANRLAVTKDDQKVADGFLAAIEIIELGYEAGVKRAIERAEKRNLQL